MYVYIAFLVALESFPKSSQADDLFNNSCFSPVPPPFSWIKTIVRQYAERFSVSNVLKPIIRGGSIEKEKKQLAS